jgi:RecA-family ATPase
MKNSVPSEEYLRIFMHVVFGYLDGFIPMRSFAEKGNKNSRPPSNIWVKADDEMIGAAMNFANAANQRQSACYVIPGVVANSGEASSSHVKQMQVLLIDIDDGDTQGKLLRLSSVLGEPTLVVESGGVTLEGCAKLHVYWQLVKGVSGDDLKALLKLRYQIALSFGGDTHFKSAHQPIRVAGSVYHKGGVSKPVNIRSYSRVEYELEELIAAYQASNHSVQELNNDVIPTTATLLTTKVFEGSVTNLSRFSSLQRVIGYWLRRCHEGLITEDQAIEEIFAYNSANVVPSWDGVRLKKMIDGIWQKHVHENGERKEMLEETKIESIDPMQWIGAPPERQWLIEDWLPRGYVTALYGDGGVGKSLLAQQIITALAIGGKFLNKQLNAFRVYALMCEDDANELWRRQTAINEHYSVTMKNLSNIRLVSRVGHDNLLMTFTNSDVGTLTKFFDELLKDISEFKPDLVVLDTAADLFGGNENNRPQVRQFIQTACGQIARVTNSAVLLCAHPSESGIQKGNGSGGSTAWNNTVRSRWYLKRPTDEGLTPNHRILSRVKSNYSNCGMDEYFEWDKGVFVSLVNDSVSIPITGQKQSKKNAAERDRKTQLILQLIDEEAACGRIYTMNQFAKKFEDDANNSHRLGSKRNLYDRLSVAATHGLIKFFCDPRAYGLELKKSRYGYICTDTTMLKVGEFFKVDSGEIVPKLIQIIPTHKKLAANGEIIEMNYEEN